MLRRFSLAAFAFAAVLTLPACDSGSSDDDNDFYTPATSSELSALETDIGCEEVKAVDSDGSMSGELEASDCTLGDGSSVDFYAFRIPTTATAQITLRSDDFDAFLLVFTEDGTEVTRDDDGGGGSDAQISQSLSPGLYVIAANSLDTGETGDYTLRITEAN